MHEGEELRAEFDRLFHEEQPPVGLRADRVIHQAHRVRRRRTTAAMLVSGGLTAALVVLVAVVLPSGAGRDERPLVPADREQSVVEPSPSSAASTPELPTESEPPESAPEDRPGESDPVPNPSARLPAHGAGAGGQEGPPEVSLDSSRMPIPESSGDR
ncbi:hypothetical protein [Actinoalloteichus hymeniacidonis]|uniref:Uncharacterized protein n=1 Tax=Actinoalloteichus hymeniacidonis TaxID=340345 RepID=A0AAC9HQC5_9PSEU|nr:hypothetical protein [Actinoalloteichus hymeniacidonis]AOS63383.1 hypothetical protein TL08_12845 [Actinoalloteichus hymeniacidonis]MBB5908577.1 hypothetical protein [Actinoalloteichus hymeniacidonis]